jgi:hypothetical protein
LTPDFPITKNPYMNKLRIGIAVLAMTTIAGVIPVRADQPEMKAALADLRSARRHLEHAMHNKGGQRVHAIEEVDRAIHAVEEGMANAR